MPVKANSTAMYCVHTRHAETQVCGQHEGHEVTAAERSRVTGRHNNHSIAERQMQAAQAHRDIPKELHREDYCGQWQADCHHCDCAEDDQSSLQCNITPG